jgi:hypothetical protein
MRNEEREGTRAKQSQFRKTGSRQSDDGLCETKPIGVEDKGGTPSPRAWPCVRNKANSVDYAKVNFLGEGGLGWLIVVVWVGWGVRRAPLTNE